MSVRQIFVTVVLLATAGALSGCAGLGRTDDSAIRVAASPTAPASSAASSPAASPAPTAPTAPATLVLADTGIGGLHLGQSKKQALATGLIGKIAGTATEASGDCTAYQGKRGIDLVYFHADQVMIISVTRSIRTDKGIGIGDTYLKLHQKYSDAIVDPSEEIDRIYPAAPNAQIKAGYRIAMSGDQGYPDDTILELALQANVQPCYE